MTEQALAFGVATSAYQIEGAVDADGRGPSIWDVFCSKPGAIADATDGAVACDSYHRLDEDLALLVELGVTAYRFSISWPRIQPAGSGRIESRGLDYYERLVDGLLSRDIRPFPTLYHWDLPQPLEVAGGWPTRDTALRFAEYAGVVAHRLGDRVAAWSTMNEPWCSAFLGYAAGVHAPGRQEPAAALASAHHLLLGHALGRQAVRAELPEAQVGIVLNLAPVHPEPDAPADASDMVDAIQNRLWLDALADGSYPSVLTTASPVLTAEGVARQEDLATIQGSTDWLGINYYTPYRIAAGTADSGPPTRAYPYAPPFSLAPRPPLTTMGWEIDATGLTNILLRTAARLPGMPLRVTENGAAFRDGRRNAIGRVDDQDRIAYFEGAASPEVV